MEIRKYKQEDWKRICTIHDAARIDELNGSVDPDAFMALEACYKEEALFDSEIYIAEFEQKIVGFVAFEPKEITWLYVDPNYYQKGIGSALVKFALKQCQYPIEIQVLTGNVPAVNLYKKFGFKIKETKKGTISTSKDFPASAYIMLLDN